MTTRFRIPLVKQQGILLLLLALLVSAVSITVYVFQLPVASSSVEVLSKYTHRGSYSYDLYLRPNLLFSEPVIHSEHGGYYFKNITDHLDIRFTYQFLCEPPANVTGMLETNATVFSVASRDGNVLWRKDLVTLTPSQIPFLNAEIAVQIPFDLTALYSLIEQIENEIRVYSSEYQVTFSTTIHTLADAGVGVIDERFHATMNILLNDNIITIDTGSTQDQPGTIEDLTTLSFPWVNSWRVGALIILGILTVGTGYYIPIYRRTVVHRGSESLVNKILKKYDDLIITTTATTAMPHASEKTLISVETMEDLHKIAEHTGKPIIYTQNALPQQTTDATHVFFIQDSDIVYALRIDERLPETSRSTRERSASVEPDAMSIPVPSIQGNLLKLQPLLGLLGALLVGAVLWLTVYEGVILHRDLSSIFFGPRSFFFDLGLGLRIIHYLGVGMGCCLIGAWATVKHQGFIRRLMASRTK